MYNKIFESHFKKEISICNYMKILHKTFIFFNVKRLKYIELEI